MSDLKQAVKLIKAGEKDAARRVLLAILKDNPDDEKAWLCMISCAANSRQFNTSVRNVLRINPENSTALKLAQKHQIAVNILPQSEIELSPIEHDYLEATQVSSPTVMMQQDTIDAALSDVTELMSTHQYAEDETVIFEADETIVTGKSVDEQSHTPKRRLLWLWLIVVVAAAIILFVVVGVVLSAQNQDTESAADETATSHFATSFYISGTNDAILDAENTRATQFLATQTLLVATDVALVETLNAPTPTPGPTSTPLPDVLPIDFIQAISTAFQIRGDPIQYENRSTFQSNETIQVLIDVGRNAPTMIAEVRVSRPADENFEPIVRRVRVVSDNMPQSVAFTFPAGGGWAVGEYMVQVFVDDIGGLQTTFAVVDQ